MKIVKLIKNNESWSTRLGVYDHLALKHLHRTRGLANWLGTNQFNFWGINYYLHNKIKP